jgi:hypothetical protein
MVQHLAFKETPEVGAAVASVVVQEPGSVISMQLWLYMQFTEQIWCGEDTRLSICQTNEISPRKKQISFRMCIIIQVWLCRIL